MTTVRGGVAPSIRPTSPYSSRSRWPKKPSVPSLKRKPKYVSPATIRCALWSAAPPQHSWNIDVHPGNRHLRTKVWSHTTLIFLFGSSEARRVAVEKLARQTLGKECCPFWRTRMPTHVLAFIALVCIAADDKQMATKITVYAGPQECDAHEKVPNGHQHARSACISRSSCYAL